jgi:TolA-binding protein
MTADVRILSEQVARLQVTVNQLAEQLAATNKRLDGESSTVQKAFADQQLAMTTLANGVNTVRENLSANTTRVQQLMQELPGIRTGLNLVVEQLRTLVNLLQPATDAALPPGTPGPPAAPGSPSAPAAVSSGSASGQAPLGQVSIPESPGRVFDAAFNDYMSNRLQNAVEGFTEFVQKFPTAPQAAQAQFYVGQSLRGQNKQREAIAAYGKVIENYADSDQAADAYYEQAMCYLALNQRAEARRIFELLTTDPKYKDSSAAIQATQRLKTLSTGR